MEDSTTLILESENKTYESDHHSPLEPVKIEEIMGEEIKNHSDPSPLKSIKSEETSQNHSSGSPHVKPDEIHEVKTPISKTPKTPLSNERIKRILESAEPIPKSELPANLSSSTSRFYDGTLINLSSGWLIEQRPRTSEKYLGKTDQFFYEPYTGKQFRSLKAVLKHLSDEKNKESIPLTPTTDHDLTKSEKGEGTMQRSYPWEEMKKKNKRKGGSEPILFDYQNPPQSVTWCFENAAEDLWLPQVKNPYKMRNNWTQILMSPDNAPNPNPNLDDEVKACESESSDEKAT